MHTTTLPFKFRAKRHQWNSRGRQELGRTRPPIVNFQPPRGQKNKPLSASNIRLTRIEQKRKSSTSAPIQFMWVVVYVICSTVCLVQLNDRVRLYLEYPVSVDISVIRAKELEYPAIVFCYKNPPFTQNKSNVLDYMRWIPPCESHTDKCNWQRKLLNSTLKYSDADVKYYGNWWQAQRMNKTVEQLRQEMIREKVSLAEQACTDMKYWCTEEKQQPYRDYFKARNMTLHKLWNESNIAERSITFEDPDCSEKDIKDCVTLATFNSIAGSCHVVRKDKPVLYKGDKTKLQVAIKEVHYRSNFNFGVYFQSNGPINLHSILTTVVEFVPGRQTTVRVSLKKFVAENSTERPCWDLKRTSDCINKCFLHELGLYLNCRIPSMEEARHLEECPSWGNLSSAIDEALDVYQNFNETNCLCPKPCEDNVYSVMNWERGKTIHTSKLTFTLTFADNVVEVITESLAYKFAALVSDVGGNLGIFLGASILTLIHGLVNLFMKFLVVAGIAKQSES